MSIDSGFSFIPEDKEVEKRFEKMLFEGCAAYIKASRAPLNTETLEYYPDSPQPALERHHEALLQLAFLSDAIATNTKVEDAEPSLEWVPAAINALQKYGKAVPTARGYDQHSFFSEKEYQLDQALIYEEMQESIVISENVPGSNLSYATLVALGEITLQHSENDSQLVPAD